MMGLMVVIVFITSIVMVCASLYVSPNQLTRLDLHCLATRCTIRPGVAGAAVRQLPATQGNPRKERAVMHSTEL